MFFKLVFFSVVSESERWMKKFVVWKVLLVLIPTKNERGFSE